MGHASYETASSQLAEQIQHLLLRFGIVARRSERVRPYRGRTVRSFVIAVTGMNLKRFYQSIGCRFLNDEKHEFARALASGDDGRMNYMRKEWHSAFLQDGWFRYRDRELNGEEVTNLWFNAYYFHSDVTKERRLEELGRVFSDPVLRWIILKSVLDAGHTVKNLYHLVKDTSNDNLVIKVPSFRTLRAKTAGE